MRLGVVRIVDRIKPWMDLCGESLDLDLRGLICFSTLETINHVEVYASSGSWVREMNARSVAACNVKETKYLC